MEPSVSVKRNKVKGENMKKYLLFSFVCALVPLIASAKCELKKVSGQKDQYIFPNSGDTTHAYVCGDSGCGDNEVIYVSGSHSVGNGWGGIEKRTQSSYYRCKRGGDDKWIKVSGDAVGKCENKSSNDEIETVAETKYVGVKKGNVFIDICTYRFDKENGIVCDRSKSGNKYIFLPDNRGDTVRKCDCSSGFSCVWTFAEYVKPCYDINVNTMSKSGPAGYNMTKEHVSPDDPAEGYRFPVVYVNTNKAKRVEYGLYAYDTNTNVMCSWCPSGSFVVAGDGKKGRFFSCTNIKQMAYCSFKKNVKWDSKNQKCIETATSSAQTATQSTNTNKPATKTVEERCREYNGGVECSPERLACYKKGSATKWQDGKCQCVDTNRTWKYENNDGQCVENKAVTVNNNNNTLCKTALGDLEIGKSFTGVDLENCKDTEKTETNTDAVASWEIICETETKVICKPYACTDGYELNSEIGGCVVKKIQKPETDPVNDTKKKEIENAERVVRDFFASAERNANVWRDKDGKFNTARLASDVTAGVILGTVGGVVSSVVIKKKQVEKGFDALHCTVGGQAVADWGDTFRVGIAK